MQIIVHRHNYLKDSTSTQYISQKILLDQEKENLLREYFLQASNLFVKKEGEIFPSQDLPFIVGLGNWETLRDTLNQKKLISPKPNHLIIPKLFMGRYTGAWILCNQKIRSISLNPLGFAFNFEKELKNPEDVLIYTDLYQAYNELQSYEPQLGYPNILANPNLRDIIKQLPFLTKRIYIIYHQLTNQQKEELVHLRIPAIDSQAIQGLDSFERKMLAIKKLAKTHDDEALHSLHWKKGILRRTEQGWFYIVGKRTIQATNFDLELHEVYNWNNSHIFSGLLIKYGKQARFGTCYDGENFISAVEQACEKIGFYPYIKKELKRNYFELLQAFYPHLPIRHEPCFGIMPDRSINLPTVYVTKGGIRDQYYITHCPLVLSSSDFMNYRLDADENKLVEIFVELFEQIYTGKEIKPYELYYPDRMEALRKLEMMGVLSNKTYPGFGKWIYYNEHIVVSEDKKRPVIPESVLGPRLMAVAINRWLKNYA